MLGNYFLVAIFVFIIGIIIAVVMGMNILYKSKCNKRVDGEYLNAVIQNHPKGGPTYKVRARYEVDGQVYENTSLDILKKSYITKICEKGTRGYIYINPEDPNKFVVRSGIAFGDIVLFIIGIAFILMAIFIK